MKKNLFSLMLVAVLALGLCIPVSAAAGQSGEGVYIWDASMLLDDATASELNETARQAAEKYGCGIYLVTVPDLSGLDDSNGTESAAKDFYNSSALGVGSDASGVMLFIATESRKYSLIAHGKGNDAFTDHGKDVLAEEFLDDFRKDDWAQGCRDYVNVSVEMLNRLDEGSPVDVGNELKSGRVYGIVACVILGIVFAGVICLALKAQLRSVAKQTQAAAYIPSGGVDLHQRTDVYTHTTETRVHEAPPKSSSGGTSVGSDGFSSKSGDF